MQRIMHNNMLSSISLDVMFKRIDFVIQKELAAQFVARLSSIKM
jgi:hypothetical protein